MKPTQPHPVIPVSQLATRHVCHCHHQPDRRHGNSPDGAGHQHQADRGPAPARRHHGAGGSRPQQAGRHEQHLSPAPVSPRRAQPRQQRQRRRARAQDPPPLSGGPRAAGQVHPPPQGGEPIDITPLAAVAEEMVDTMFTHGDAMLCLARIRQGCLSDGALHERRHPAGELRRYLGLERSVPRELTLGLLHDGARS